MIDLSGVDPADAAFIDTSGSGCWLWTGPVNRNGWPTKLTGPKAAARMLNMVCAALHAHPPLSSARSTPYVLAPGCGRRLCVGPAHAVYLTVEQFAERFPPLVNLDGGPIGRCRRGHLLTDDNVRISHAGLRMCQVCAREREARRPKRPRTRTVVKWRTEGVITPAPEDQSAPAIVLMRRYQCPGCRHTYGHKDTAVNHMKTCFKLPANRACATCCHYLHGEHSPACAAVVEFAANDKGTYQLRSGCALWQER